MIANGIFYITEVRGEMNINSYEYQSVYMYDWGITIQDGNGLVGGKYNPKVIRGFYMGRGIQAEQLYVMK